MADNENKFDPEEFQERMPFAALSPKAPAQSQSSNPLSAFFRQPKIHVALPSGGRFWPEGSLAKSETGEYPVFAMTARDELLFKTPDALMNGSAIVEVIQSCIPSIKDAWKMPSLDVDAVLTAIRMATYGEEMDVTATCPKCNHSSDKVVDLRTVLDSLISIEFQSRIEIGTEMLVHLRPMTYSEISQTALKAFEHQRIFSIINDDKIDDDKKMKLFNESFVKLTDLTLDTAVRCITKVESIHGSTDDPAYIKEFLQNADKSVFKAINDSVNKSQDSGKMASFPAVCDNEECKHEWKMKITLDQADFFGNGFRNSQ